MISSYGAVLDDVIEARQAWEDYFRSRRDIFSSLSGVYFGTSWSQT